MQEGKSPIAIQKSTVSKNLKFISNLLAISASFPVLSSSAKVFIDTDLYGDKELKIATINKLKVFSLFES